MGCFLLQLLLEHARQADAFSLRQVLGHHLVEEAAVGIAAILAEQASRLEGLPHLFEQDGKKRSFQAARRVVEGTHPGGCCHAWDGHILGKEL